MWGFLVQIDTKPGCPQERLRGDFPAGPVTKTLHT